MTQWIRRSTRLSIYMRDRFTCQWCELSFPVLTLDHVRPLSRGGTHCPSNLVTACLSCNSARQDKTLRQFAQFKGFRGALARIHNARRRTLPRLVAKRLLCLAEQA